jgi:L-alanine-DL-glutamate epimerase-like enolase superfamily enzyme
MTHSGHRCPSNCYLARAISFCEAAQLGCRMGATVGSQLLAAHAVHVIASLRHLTFPCELAEFLHLTNDPFEGLEVKDGMIRVPDEIASGTRLAKDIQFPV